MALYPIGDPRRPLQLAVRSMRLLGILLTAIGLLAMVFVAIPAGRAGGPASLATIVLLAVCFVYLVPGVLYILFSIFLTQKKHWAVIAGLVLASIHALLAAISFVFSFLSTGLNLPVIVVGLVVAALIQLIFHLSKSFDSIRASAGDQRGFEPLPTQSPGNWPPPSPPAR